jgi:hypothetical protein
MATSPRRQGPDGSRVSGVTKNDVLCEVYVVQVLGDLGGGGQPGL